MRIKVSIPNEKDNYVGDFVVLNGDKSKSSLNNEFYTRLDHLIKEFEGFVKNKKGIADKEKEREREYFSEKDVVSRLCSNPHSDCAGIYLNPALGLRYDRDHADGDRTNQFPIKSILAYSKRAQYQVK